jgi:hypothetical protein
MGRPIALLESGQSHLAASVGMLYRTAEKTANFNPSALAACLSLMALIACARTTPSADNPNGVDPTVDNPRPKEIIKIRVLAPTPLKLSLYENRSAPVAGDSGRPSVRVFAVEIRRNPCRVDTQSKRHFL